MFIFVSSSAPCFPGSLCWTMQMIAFFVAQAIRGVWSWFHLANSSIDHTCTFHCQSSLNCNHLQGAQDKKMASKSCTACGEVEGRTSCSLRRSEQFLLIWTITKLHWEGMLHYRMWTKLWRAHCDWHGLLSASVQSEMSIVVGLEIPVPSPLLTCEEGGFLISWPCYPVQPLGQVCSFCEQSIQTQPAHSCLAFIVAFPPLFVVPGKPNNVQVHTWTLWVELQADTTFVRLH